VQEKLAWLSEQNVPLIRVDWQGNAQTVLSNNGYAANQHRVQWQVRTRADLRQRMAFSSLRFRVDFCGLCAVCPLLNEETRGELR
jgi:hypothetical protein